MAQIEREMSASICMPNYIDDRSKDQLQVAATRRYMKPLGCLAGVGLLLILLFWRISFIGGFLGSLFLMTCWRKFDRMF